MRPPRFRRVPTRRFELTERDRQVLVHVHRHRFLRSTQIADLVEGSPAWIRRRLQLLYHNHFLDRPRSQIEYYVAGGSKPITYGLGNAGADLLAREHGIRREKVDWTAKNRSVKPLFLDHTLLVAETMVGLELACREDGDVAIVDFDEILEVAPPSTRRLTDPAKWRVPVTRSGKRFQIGVVPDKIFGLRFFQELEGRNRAYFFLEADTGTMPVERRSFTGTSFYKKVVAYYETWRQGLHSKQYGIKSFRVLTVTSGPERAANLRAAALQATGEKASRLFLFTDRASINGGDLLDLLWHDAAGNPTTLRD